jgi:hypothetical protein
MVTVPVTVTPIVPDATMRTYTVAGKTGLLEVVNVESQVVPSRENMSAGDGTPVPVAAVIV